MQSSFIIFLEQDSDPKIEIGMVPWACFCLDASFLSFAIAVLHHAIFL